MDKELINSAQVQEFLQDFETNATVELLEDAKEQSEIFEIALARGINLKESKDIAGFKCVYCFADIANKNKARLPKKALLKALPTLVGKPVDIDHLRNYCVGVLIDSRYIVKDESVIAYGILFKSNFPDEWTNIEKKFKAKNLSVSYEIYCPVNKRIQHEDGTYSLEEQIIAGMAILDKESPAFTNAKVLELAKEKKTPEELVFASYKCTDIIINGKPKCQNCGKCKSIETAETKPEEKKLETPKTEEKKIEGTGRFFTKEELLTKKDEVKVEEKPVTPVAVTPVAIPKIRCQGCNTELDYVSIKEKGMGYIECPTCKKNIDQTGRVLISKIKCANCQKEFDAPQFATSEIKCSECFAIINEKGEILYPPQIIDFNISCPSCSSRNWRLLKKDEATGEIKCLSCAKKYAITFKTVTSNALLDMVQFLHIGHVSCKQCGHYIGYSGTSKSTIYNLKCIKCGLTFTHDIIKDGQVKQLSTITEVIEPIKASEEIPSKADELIIDKSAIKEEAKGEVKMEIKSVENIVEVVVASTPIAQPEVAEVKPVVAELPVEAKVEEKPVEEVKPIEAKIEEVVIPTVETKTEVVSVVESKVETPVEAKIEVNTSNAPIVEVKTEETIDASVPPEVKKIMDEMMKTGMPFPEAMKKAWMQYKKTQKTSNPNRKKIADKIKKQKKVVKASIEKIEFYKVNAEEINKRRKELGDAGKNLSDEELIDNAKFSDAKLVQANLETSSIVGTKKTDEDNIKRLRDEITAKAEGRMKRMT